MLRYYPAIVHKDPDSDYGVSFPDFPGCVSAGASQSEALVMAKEALILHIEGLIEDHEAIPDPSPIDHVQKTTLTERGVTIVTLIEAALPGPAKRVNITVEESLLDEIDALAASEGMSRSAFLANAAREKMELMLLRRMEAVRKQHKSDAA